MRKYIKRYLLFGILSDTVLNNLKYGNADAGFPDIENAVKMSRSLGIHIG